MLSSFSRATSTSLSTRPGVERDGVLANAYSSKAGIALSMTSLQA